MSCLTATLEYQTEINAIISSQALEKPFSVHEILK